MTKLMETRPEGGSAGRKRRFAENMMNCLDRAHRIDTHNMKQLKNDVRDAAD